jgi:hypothetical protein
MVPMAGGRRVLGAGGFRLDAHAFSTGRDKRYHINGGVFDVPANAADIVIPIRAALMVRKPAAFARAVRCRYARAALRSLIDGGVHW